MQYSLLLAYQCVY